MEVTLARFRSVRSHQVTHTRSTRKSANIPPTSITPTGLLAMCTKSRRAAWMLRGLGAAMTLPPKRDRCVQVHVRVVALTSET